MNQKPVAIGISLCEQVIFEERTGNATLVNCFTIREAERFPSEFLSFFVFAVLTDGLGTIPLEVSVQRLDTLDEIYRRGATYRFADPLNEVRCLMRIKKISFPEKGYYQVTLWADKEPIAQRKIRLDLKEKSP